MRVRKALRAGLALLMTLMLAIPGASLAGRIENFFSFLLGEEAEPVRLTLSIEAKQIPQFDEHRLEQLNQLLGHFSAEILNSGKTASLRLLTDQQETLQMTVVREEAEEKMVFSYAPHIGYAVEGETNPLIPSVDETWMELAGLTGLLLEEGYDFFSGLPENCPENSKETAVRQNIGKVGKATRKVTVSWSRQEAENGAFEALLEKMPQAGLKKMLSACQWSGAQRAVLYFNSENRLIKVSYSGQAFRGEGADRKITVEWRCLRDAERIFDELTIKTPAVRGNDRNNLIIRRNETPGEAEKTELSLEYDRVANKVRTRMKGKASFAWDSQLTGEAELKTIQDGETSLIRLKPEISGGTGEKEYAGKLAISRETGTITEEELTVRFALSPGETVPEPKTEAVIFLDATPEGMPEAYTLLKGEITNIIFSKLIRLPAQDLGFLTEGFSDEELSALLGMLDEESIVLPERQ